MKPGDTIIVLPSIALSNLKLDALIGQTATIIQVNRIGSTVKGCWVKLPGLYLGEQEWYIPYISVGI